MLPVMVGLVLLRFCAMIDGLSRFIVDLSWETSGCKIGPARFGFAVDQGT